MNLVRKFIIAFPAALLIGLSGAGLAPVLAASACNVHFVGTTNDASRSTSRVVLSNNDTTATINFQLSGASDCQNTLTIASWEAPNAVFDHANIAAQKLHGSTTKTFTGAGSYSISVSMMDCYYQIDLLSGSKATAPDGTPFYNPGPLAWAQGGTKSCVQPPAAVYACNAIDVISGSNRLSTINSIDVTAKNGATLDHVVIDWGDQSATVTAKDATNQTHTYANDGTYKVTVTAHFTVNGKDVTPDQNGCNQTVSFTTPTPTPTPPTTQTQLPNTGAGNILGMFLGASVIGAAGRWFMVRRSRA